MRVISGEKRGLRLTAPKGTMTRPTEDRIKESIFNSLFSIEEGSKVLDLFAGTGGMGIEFLSRGSDLVVFCDRSRLNINCIKENLDITGFSSQAKIYHGDNERNLFNIKSDNIRFDYIFLDPPYHQINLYYDSLDFIKDNCLLNEEGIIIVEAEQKLDFDGYDIIKTKEYGKKIIYFLGGE